ncbi:L-ascorbate metabolism protein UlaG, beta-lactamase superfamily [Geodermatophilus africanus]|uniref:L-ascorbate metabolism protein UlaG, beta-lactamase superfamily n=1 Tax=Geodermatophilus africanus TaxID=1137993 RepID=A0A1H3QSY3_9ACTN|nr:MBL fold metallo-hydrolase [Geodermatophilus africanus]SDZ16151.1 L-ascorbate metabolism protein UlaG, beta-lactamase superfamily [Geodermatophilus africanus]
MGGLHLHFLGHSTARVELAGHTVLTDPLLTARVGPLRRMVPAPAPETFAGVDLVLVSHLHGDHLHLPSLRLLGRDVRVVVPRGAGAWLRARGFAHVSEVLPGETIRHGALRVTAVPALHSGHRWGPRLTHGPDTAAVGHLITGGGRTVYAAGDTGLLDTMWLLGERGVDVALLPVWGWGLTLGHDHLDPADAAEATARLRPRVAVPVHWGTLALPGVERLPRMRRLLVEPPRDYAAAVAARGLDTAVVVAEPGRPVPLPEPAGTTS